MNDDLIAPNLSRVGRTLYLTRAMISAGLVIPASVTTLDLTRAMISAGLVIPASVTTLYLTRATIPAGLVIPASVTTLDLSGATIPAGLVIPASVTTLYLTRATIPAGGHYTDDRGYTLYSLPRSDGDRAWFAGCRTFYRTAAALAHWGAAGYPNRSRGDAFCAAIKRVEGATNE